MTAAISGYGAYNANQMLRPWGVAKNNNPAEPEGQKTTAVTPENPPNSVTASGGKPATVGQPAAQPAAPATESSVGSLKVDDAGTDQMLKRIGIKECETCKARQYQDGSNDPGVSFKTPTHISPDNAAMAVSSHEQEHVMRERSKAQREDRQVVYQSVMIFTATCPECGRSYVSGGRTVTVTAAAAAVYSDGAGVMKQNQGSELDEAV